MLVRAVIVPALLFILLATPAANAVESGSWTATGSMTVKRAGHTATVLTNGKVLVAGGFDSNLAATASAELYDPASGTWTATGNMTTARVGHAATLLANGNVLVAGDIFGGSAASAELYNPATGTWAATGSMTTPREYFTATLLPNGKVLAAGGWDPSVPCCTNPVASAELYDPAAGTWTATGTMATPRGGFTATLLASGKVLVAGGSTTGGALTSSAELYDPGSGTWTATANMVSQHANHTATLLQNGKVLVVGAGFSSPYASAELYDPSSGSWSATGGTIHPRVGHTAALLPSGKVLVASNGSPPYSPTAELYDPGSGTWTAMPDMGTGRSDATASLLSSAKVLVAGGTVSAGSPPCCVTDSAELFTLPPAVTLLSPPEGQVYTQGQFATASYSCAAGAAPLAAPPNDCAGANDGSPHASGSAINTSSLGGHTFTVTALDTAGQTTTVTHTYSVFGSLGGPVSPPPALNMVNAGAGVPVTFGLGGYFGSSIFEVDYPKSQQISCSTHAAVGVLESTVSTPAGLQYNAATNQYTYLWKTDKSWSGTCRELFLKFAASGVGSFSGAQAVFLFQFK